MVLIRAFSASFLVNFHALGGYGSSPFTPPRLLVLKSAFPASERNGGATEWIIHTRVPTGS